MFSFGTKVWLGFEWCWESFLGSEEMGGEQWVILEFLFCGKMEGKGFLMLGEINFDVIDILHVSC